MTVGCRGIPRSSHSEHGLLPVLETANILRRSRENRTATAQEIRPEAKRKLQGGASEPRPASQSQPSLFPQATFTQECVEEVTLGNSLRGKDGALCLGLPVFSQCPFPP